MYGLIFHNRSLFGFFVGDIELFVYLLLKLLCLRPGDMSDCSLVMSPPANCSFKRFVPGEESLLAFSSLNLDFFSRLLLLAY